MSAPTPRRLRDLISILGEIPEDNPPTIYAREPWAADSEAILLPWTVPMDRAPAGFEYVIETELAKEVLEVWSTWRQGAVPNIEEATAAVLYYAEYDTFEPVLSAAEVVWNRAVLGPTGSGVGDRHLAALAKPHDRIMTGGVASILHTCSPEEVQAAADAFAYLGLDELAAVTRQLAVIEWYGLDREHRLNRAFYGLEHALDAAFRDRYARSPEDFDPAEGAHAAATLPTICPGDLRVHELRTECSLGDACATVPNHARAHLHRVISCDLCPSGPGWPG